MDTASNEHFMNAESEARSISQQAPAIECRQETARPIPALIPRTEDRNAPQSTPPISMLRKAANLLSPPTSPNTRRTFAASIRRRFGRSKSPRPHDEQPPRQSMDERIPQFLQDGVFLTKVSAKKERKMLFRLDVARGQLVWESKVTKYIAVEAIREIRTGDEAKQHRLPLQPSNEDYDDRWLTVIYTVAASYKTMHLLAPSREIMNSFVQALEKLSMQRAELLDGLNDGQRLDALWARQYWNGHGMLFDDILRLCAWLGVHQDEAALQALFQEADVRGDGCLDFEDFQRFARLIRARPDVEHIYNRLVRQHGRFDFNAFQKFMVDIQRSELNSSQLQTIFYSFVDPVSTSTAPAVMTLEYFTAFLVSVDNPSFIDSADDLPSSPPMQNRTLSLASSSSNNFGAVSQDMTRPLSEYFISSSHNTYLSGHQLVGESTVEGYVRALQAGCRSVEIDIHPGSPTPVVTHGNTLTSKVPLRAVCEAIDKYAFVASPYPIIISAEIHCSVAQQDMIVEIMTEVFGERLVTAPIDGTLVIEQLPSPEELKGRILLKAKNVQAGREERSGFPDTSSSALVDSNVEDSEITGSESPHDSPFLRALSLKHVRRRSKGATDSSPPSSFIPLPTVSRPSSASGSESGNSSATNNSKPKISAALASILVYTVGTKFRGINKKEEYAPEHMFSLSESTASKIVRSSSGTALDLVKHTRSHLVRVYPKSIRVSSSNYLPHHYWAAGAQLVALNWQTLDTGTLLNHAMFRRNGGAGYVLKPPALRLPSHKELLAQKTEHVLELSIISAQQLPSPKSGPDGKKATVDPFVEVSLYVPDWTGFQQQPTTSLLFQPPPSSPTSPATPFFVYRTSADRANAFNPTWDERLRIPFTCIGHPGLHELVFVRFAVRQEGSTEDEPLLGVHCVPLACLPQGYRHLPLNDSQLADCLFSSLFIKVGIKDL
ncbi:Phosphoinositide phospholipase C [Mycena chlorophos]|uniref:Phosphoinositide phospholipase C n=1 Tax=Mycena chlorophos TaxID=658473 RepID=A0A8H6TH39_MYCCL|nr:Phosphoinositide phospholipase C [Mycena chlorophos]